MNDDIYNTDGFIIKDNGNNNSGVVNNDDIYNTDGFIIKNNDLNNNSETSTNEELNTIPEIKEDNNNSFNFLNNNEPKKEKNYDEQIDYEADMVKAYIGDNYNKFITNKFNIYCFFLGGIYLTYRKKYGGILLFLLFFTLFYNFYSNIFILIALILLYFLVNYYLSKSFNEKYMNKVYDDCMRVNEEYKNRNDIEIIRICRTQGGVSAFFTILLSALIISANVYLGPILKDKFDDIFNKESGPKTSQKTDDVENTTINEDQTDIIDDQSIQDNIIDDQLEQSNVIDNSASVDNQQINNNPATENINTNQQIIDNNDQMITNQ